MSRITRRTIVPVNQITPLTYRDGVTYIQMLTQLSDYIKSILHPSLQHTVDQIVADVEAQMDTHHDQYVDGVQEFQRIHDAFMSDVNAHLIALNDTALSDLLGDPTSATYQQTMSVLLEYVHNRLGANVMALFPRESGDLDDTERIQRAMDYCAEHGFAFTVEGDTHFTGEYVVRDVRIPTSLSVVDLGGRVYRRPNLSDPKYGIPRSEQTWVRMFSMIHQGRDDMGPMVIRNGVLDGNDVEQWTNPNNPNYELEHQALVFINSNGSGQYPGLARVHVENMTFRNCTSDGLHVVANSVVTATNLHSIDCFRGGVTITGGRSTVTVEGWISESIRDGMLDGLDVEIDSFGYGESRTSTINISNVIIDRDLDAHAPRGSVINLTNITMKKGMWTLGASVGGVVNLHDSQLIEDSDDDNWRVVSQNGGTLNFYNTVFEGSETAVKILFYNTTASDDDMVVNFTNCDFKNAGHGVATSVNSRSKVTFKGCTFHDSIDGLAIGAPYDNVPSRIGSIYIADTEFNNPGYWLLQQSTLPSHEGHIRVGSVNIPNPDNQGIRVHAPIITWLGNPTFEHGGQVSVTPGGNPTFRGERQVLDS